MDNFRTSTYKIKLKMKVIVCSDTSFTSVNDKNTWHSKEKHIRPLLQMETKCGINCENKIWPSTAHQIESNLISSYN
jgi:hypothetical protein